MIKLVINNETGYPVIVNEMNYASTMRINNYASPQTNITLNINLDQLSNIQHFEDIKITSLQVLNSQNDTSIATLSFTEDLYFTSYNANIQDENARVYVSVTKIQRQQEEE